MVTWQLLAAFRGRSCIEDLEALLKAPKSSLCPLAFRFLVACRPHSSPWTFDVSEQGAGALFVLEPLVSLPTLHRCGQLSTCPAAPCKLVSHRPRQVLGVRTWPRGEWTLGWNSLECPSPVSRTVHLLIFQEKPAIWRMQSLSDLMLVND